MCSECYRAVCVTGCPYRRDDRSRRAVCARCGEPIFEDGGGYYLLGECALCADCADTVTVEELIELAHLSGVGELLSLLGFRYYA